jgi:hypothetical protein
VIGLRVCSPHASFPEGQDDEQGECGNLSAMGGPHYVPRRATSSKASEVASAWPQECATARLSRGRARSARPGRSPSMRFPPHLMVENVEMYLSFHDNVWPPSRQSLSAIRPYQSESTSRVSRTVSGRDRYARSPGPPIVSAQSAKLPSRRSTLGPSWFRHVRHLKTGRSIPIGPSSITGHQLVGFVTYDRGRHRPGNTRQLCLRVP